MLNSLPLWAGQKLKPKTNGAKDIKKKMPAVVFLQIDRTASLFSSSFPLFRFLPSFFQWQPQHRSPEPPSDRDRSPSLCLRWETRPPPLGCCAKVCRPQSHLRPTQPSKITRAAPQICRRSAVRRQALRPPLASLPVRWPVARPPPSSCRSDLISVPRSSPQHSIFFLNWSATVPSHQSSNASSLLELRPPSPSCSRSEPSFAFLLDLVQEALQVLDVMPLRSGLALGRADDRRPALASAAAGERSQLSFLSISFFFFPFPSMIPLPWPTANRCCAPLPYAAWPTPKRR